MLTDQQLQARRAGIGGSDVAAILGLSKWRTPLDVYLDKRGEGTPQPENPAMRWGSLLEPVIVDEFQRATGLAVRRDLGLLQSDAHPFMLANLDGLAEDGAIVECKTARSGDGWGEPGTAEIPVYYQTQVGHYMAVTGARLAYVPVLIGASDFRVYQVERDDQFVADLIEAERVFWFDHVVARVPPEPRTAEDAAKLWSRDNGTAIEVDAATAASVDELKSIRQQIKVLEERAEAIDDAIRIAFGEAATMTHAGRQLATYKAQTSKRLDTKAIEAAHPELVAAFRRESVSRVLRLAK